MRQRKTFVECLEKARKAYENCDVKEQSLLHDIFGDDILPMEERIRTLDDAMNFLGKQHPLVQARDILVSHESEVLRRVIAGIELKIICTALNGGDELDGFGYTPVFSTKDELDSNDAVFAQTCDNGFFVYDCNRQVPCGHGVYHSPEHTLRSRRLAEYASKQFIEYWREYFLKVYQ